MAMSLAFHIVFAVVGMAMPLLMVIAEVLYVRTDKPVYLDLARRWAKGTAVLFAVGAVSGTVLSFELGLLWPTFMERAGPIIGMPFSLEGFAFFLEAIFLGIYLYGWDRVSRRVHIASGVMVALSGLASGVFVVAVNAWMNTPAGFTVENGVFSNIDLVAAFFSPAFPTQALHMALAAYTSVAFIVMGIHAWRLLRAPRSDFHRKAFAISFALALVSTPLQIVSGDLAAKHIAEHQPTKLAAAEALFQTERGAGISIGGIVNEAEGKLEGAIVVPYALSVLAKGDPTATVQGLEDFPRDEWPPVAIVHYAFQVMVGAGFAMLAVVLWGAVRWVRMRGRWADSRAFLTAATIAGPLGLIAVEAGWFVTEVGRQPWIIRGIMKTSEAVTPMPYLVVPFVVFSALYLMLGLVVLLLLRAYVRSAPEDVSPESAAEPVSPPAGRRPQTRPAS